ncbi:MAG: hypothetical protein C4522_09110 [Desulfobacteraceae bacterium]|nr:MAG: hypothetical protein C4522_09110 [Desulfobacteraceae bacterium]
MVVPLHSDRFRPESETSGYSGTKVHPPLTLRRVKHNLKRTGKETYSRFHRQVKGVKTENEQ